MRRTNIAAKLRFLARTLKREARFYQRVSDLFIVAQEVRRQRENHIVNVARWAHKTVSRGGRKDA